ncbi:MAG TPA: MBL fold metallo-hydrolase [Steroidobacteraceae bacterium]|nr:MBL fold metallo-hydrolase [Steroidobacteraceae bacterium]
MLMTVMERSLRLMRRDSGRWQQAALLIAFVAGLLCGAPALVFAQDLEKSEIHAQALRGNLQVLLGYGGNIAVSTGPDGTLLVDDEYAALTPKVRAALAALQASPVRLIVNTHWHDDHTGGNEAFARDGALIIAQENAARRMRTDQIVSLYGPQKAYPPVAWPAITFDQALRLRWNGDDIDVIHVGPAHTDGDAIVFFRRQNVLLTGDLFVGYLYRPPYFDDLNGGSAHGMIAAADTLLRLIDERTIIVPGHGEVTDRAGLQDYRDRLVLIRNRIAEAIARGLTEDEVVALHPTEGFAKAGRGTDRWVRVVYREYHPRSR